jgi:hypothetical protein
VRQGKKRTNHLDKDGRSRPRIQQFKKLRIEDFVRAQVVRETRSNSRPEAVGGRGSIEGEVWQELNAVRKRPTVVLCRDLPMLGQLANKLFISGMQEMIK